MYDDSTKRIRVGSCLVFKKKTELSARVGVSVKTNLGSVVRNSLKRQVRETFRMSRGTLPAFDYNIVIQTTNKIPNMDVYIKDVRSSLEKLWKSESNYESKIELKRKQVI